MNQATPLPTSSLPGDALATEHEFAFTRADFERVCRLIRERAGINLQPGKQAMVYSRLSRRLRETGTPSFAVYLDRLERLDIQHDEWQAFTNCLTTNLTSFFRESHHFDVLAQQFAAWNAPRCRIWCSAASTGEEPYTLAMVAAESLRSGITAEILATDIDTHVLATAARAVYSAEARGLSPERLKRHFLRGVGNNAGSIRVRPELARMIRFETFNLMSNGWASLGEPFDIVFCRNVMIYFDHATQRRVLEQIHRVMKPHGRLFVGHSENFTDAKGLFRLEGKTVYERL